MKITNTHKKILGTLKKRFPKKLSRETAWLGILLFFCILNIAILVGHSLCFLRVGIDADIDTPVQDASEKTIDRTRLAEVLQLFEVRRQQFDQLVVSVSTVISEEQKGDEVAPEGEDEYAL